MPKLKTNRSVAKRFRFSKSGRVKKRNARRGHMLTGKTSKRKRHLRRKKYLSGADEKKIKMLLPYGRI